MRSMLLGLALLLPTTALAEPIESQKIITAATGDWNGDGATDLAMIVETEPGDAMDMHFFLRDKQHNFLKPAGIVHDKIYGEWNDYDQPGYEGTNIRPELTALPNGSIKLYLPGMIGPGERTDMTLTIAWRNDAFVVTDVAYDYYQFQTDTIESSCDYDVLTGKGTSSKRQEDGSMKQAAVSVEGKVIPFAEWDAGIAFSTCGD
jgi:hypothetical protein